jgi:rubrerythrin
MHGPDPSWCARLHAPTPVARTDTPADARPSADAHPSADTRMPANERAPEAPPAVGGTPEAQPGRFFVPREIPSVHECELCGTVMYDHNCKIVCPNCGYKRDCSDP